MIKFFKQKNKLENKGFTRLVDFCDAISSRTKSASPKLTTGFTLVETLVAIAIFSITIITMMSVLSSGITNTTYARDKIIAGYLAQEGIEYIRNMRDTSILNIDETNGRPKGWDEFQTKVFNECGVPGNAEKTCYFDDSGVIHKCLNGNNENGVCPNLRYDSTTGKYNYTLGADSIFIRSIQAKYPRQGSDTNEIKISSTIYWPKGADPTGNKITFSESLFNWTE